MVTKSNATKGSFSRCLLWLLLWLLAIAVSLAPAVPQLPVGKADLSDYPWLFLREEKQPERSEELVELIVVGDIMLGRGVGNRIDLFDQVAPWLVGADLLAGNLESVISIDGENSVVDAWRGAALDSVPVEDEKRLVDQPQAMILWQPLHLVAPTSSAALLQRAGFDVLGMANNHALDGGAEGLEASTLKLGFAGIDVVGAGHSAAAAYRPVIRRVRECEIAFIAFTVIPPSGEPSHSGWTVATWDRVRILEAIETAHSQNDVVIVMLHWGEEYIPQANAWQREIARELALAGADLVVGHHPHTVQGTEIIGQPALLRASGDRVHLVAYSLGNFVFDQYSPESLQGLALRVFLDGQGLLAVQALPIMSAPVPLLIAPDEAASLLEWVMPEPTRVRYACTSEGCEVMLMPYFEASSPDPSVAIPWAGNIDLTGDGNPEIVRRQGEGLSIFQGNSVVWQSPVNWSIVDFALGDPNDDGRAEVVVALQKPDTSGVLQSHPFILGFRSGMYRLMWGGSAVAQPIREVEIGDVDSDGVQELVVIEDQKDEKQTLSVWKWHGWGFSLVWRSKPTMLQDLRLVHSGDRLLLEVGIIER